MKRLIACMIAVTMVAVLVGCPKKTRDQVGEMDTPAHHVTTAKRLIASGNWEGAHKEYGLALSLDPKYVPALIGDAIYFAQKGDTEKADELRRAASGNTGGDSKKQLLYYIGVVEFYSYRKGPDWLAKAEKAYNKAMKIDPNNEYLHFNMGKAYMAAHQWMKAEKKFYGVIETDRDLAGDADVLWKKVQKIRRARPGSVAGKKIALVEKITKADVAALFVEEMHLPELWRKRGIKTWETPGFRTPGEAAKAKRGKIIKASDLAGHPLETDMVEVIKLGIRGLEVDPSGRFYPNKAITRAEYAIMLEDVLVKVLNEPGLRSKYVGEAESKFHDMRTGHFAYNAAVVVTSRQMLEQDMEGNFKPLDAVDGASALLAIRKMMDYLKIG